MATITAHGGQGLAEHREPVDGATVYKILRSAHPWRYLRITYSANTNVTNTADLWVF